MTRPAIRVFSALEDFSCAFDGNGQSHKRNDEERISEALQQGLQRGFEAGRLEVRAFAEQQMRDLTQSLAAEKAAAEFNWQMEIGRKLADDLTAGLAALAEAIEGHVASHLKEILTDALYSRALQEFRSTLDRAIADGAIVQVRGSQNLIQGIEQRIGNRASIVSVASSDVAAVEVKCNQTTISADFAAWRSKLEEHLS